MEYVLGPLIAALGFWGGLKLIRAIDNSRNPIIQGIVLILGTLAAISLAKDVFGDKKDR